MLQCSIRRRITQKAGERARKIPTLDFNLSLAFEHAKLDESIITNPSHAIQTISPA